MKKISTLIILTLLLLGCIDTEEKKTGLEGKLMPSFNLLLMDSTSRLNTDSLPSGKPILLFFFSPDCPHCREQTEEIISNAKLIKNIRFYMVSNSTFGQLKSFYNRYHLYKYSDITVGQDYNSSLVTYFGITSVPYMALYNKYKQLIKIFKRKTEPNMITNMVLK